jgi:phosphoribosyl 1,2-cyclic phosphodiesterase
VEANHDLRMLMAGPYPAHVKQRVMGRTGHLSNDQSADLLREAVTQATRAVFLAHLSEKNNDSALALESGRRALREAGRDAVPLHLTHRSRASAAVEV